MSWNNLFSRKKFRISWWFDHPTFHVLDSGMSRSECHFFAIYSPFLASDFDRVLEAMPLLRPGSASAVGSWPLTDGSGCTLSATSVGSGSCSRSASTSSPWSVWSLPAFGPTNCCAGAPDCSADDSGVPASSRQSSSSSSRTWCSASTSPRTRSSISEH